MIALMHNNKPQLLDQIDLIKFLSLIPKLPRKMMTRRKMRIHLLMQSPSDATWMSAAEGLQWTARHSSQPSEGYHNQKMVQNHYHRCLERLASRMLRIQRTLGHSHLRGNIVEMEISKRSQNSFCLAGKPH